MGTPRFFLKFYTWDPRSYGEQWVSSLDHGIVYGPGVPLGTRNICFRRDLLRLPRQDYYRNMFGFWILQLGSWPLSSSYVVFYFCRKSLTCLEGAGVGVITQVPFFAAFHVWRSRVLIAPCISQFFFNNYTMCSLYCVARSVLIHALFTMVL